MFKKNLAFGLILAASVASAATLIDLPDPNVSVDLRFTGTTYVTVGGVRYGGPSAFVYVSECAKPDGPRYRCNIEQETGVTLYAADNTSIMVDLTVQFASTLITSGRNWWKPSQTVLDGTVTTL